MKMSKLGYFSEFLLFPLSTPERSCIGSPERICINDSGKKAPDLGAFS